MMGVMDLGLMDRESGAARPLADWAADPSPAPVSPPPAAWQPQPIYGGAYAPRRSRGTVLAAILALHVVAIGALVTARYHADAPERQPRVTSFAIAEPPPPPPSEPLPADPTVQPVSAPIAAPIPALDVPRTVEVQAVRPEAVRPAITPAVVVNTVTPPTPARAAAAPAAPVIAPDFSAAQLRNPGPSYPYLSRKAKEEGVVLLKVLVSTDGRAARLQIEESSGFDRLDEAALKTVGKWRFVPASQAGQPREAWVIVPVTFSLG